MNKLVRVFLCMAACYGALRSGDVAAQGTTPVIRTTYPQSRAVFQRNNDNTSRIYVSGSYYQPIDSVQARLVAEVSGQGINTNWTTIQRNPTGGVFQGALRVFGGWYRLQLRALAGGNVVGEDEVRKIGVGEVFIITGQSNAQGIPDLGAVGATDDRVNCVAYNNTETNSLADPPAPTFQQLSAASVIGPRGQSAWCWGILGDLIARQYNVPVLFINTAWAGTVSREWRESAEGKTPSRWYNGVPYPPGMPYANLRIALNYYCSLQGLRAVLWQQGENDNVPLKTSREVYRQNMQFLINKTRDDTQRYPAWVLARSSYINGQVSNDIVGAQNDVITTYNNNVYAGPYTDNIQVPRPDNDVHFGGEGLRQLAQAWYQSMSAVFFASSIPLLPQPSPNVAVSCGAGNNSVTLTLPTTLPTGVPVRSYRWNSGQTGRTLTVTQTGTYRAVLKDAVGNTFISPAVDVVGPIQPATPAVGLARQPNQPAAAQQQVCADSSLGLVAVTSVANSVLWNTGAVTRALNANRSGTYSVQVANVYGCRSAQSAPVQLTVRPALRAPTVAQVGTYSLEANPAAGQQDAERYEWRRGGEQINQTGAIVKVTTNGNYTARAQRTFTLGSSTITCSSAFSEPVAFTVDPSNDGVSVYPNPSSDGRIAVESIEDIPNAEVAVYSLRGRLIYSTTMASFSERQFIDLVGVPSGRYILKIRSGDFTTSKRITIVR